MKPTKTSDRVTPSVEDEDSSGGSSKQVETYDEVAASVRKQSSDEPLNESGAHLSAAIGDNDEDEEKEVLGCDEQPTETQTTTSVQSARSVSGTEHSVLKRRAEMMLTQGKIAKVEAGETADAHGSKLWPDLNKIGSQVTKASEETKGEDKGKQKIENPDNQEIVEAQLSVKVKAYLTGMVNLVQCFKTEEDKCSDIGLRTSLGVLLVGEPEDDKTQFDRLVEKLLLESGLFCRSVLAARLNKKKAVDELLMEVFEASTPGFVLIKKIEGLSDKTAPAVESFLRRIEDVRLPVVTIGTTTDFANVNNGIGAYFVKRPVQQKPPGAKTSFIRPF